MAATRNVPQLLTAGNSSSPIVPPQQPQLCTAAPRSGVITVYGFGVKIHLDRGHLTAEDGIGPERRQWRLPRVGHGLRRLVMIGSDGFITFEAMRFISDVGAAFVMLDRRGKIISVTGPVSPSDAKLRRTQALALGNGTALRISKELISRKLDGQAALVREMLHVHDLATAIERLKARLPGADSIESRVAPFITVAAVQERTSRICSKFGTAIIDLLAP